MLEEIMLKKLMLFSLFAIQPFISAQQEQFEPGTLIGTIGGDMMRISPITCPSPQLTKLRESLTLLLTRVPMQSIDEELYTTCYKICVLCLNSSIKEYGMSLGEQLQWTIKSTKCIGQKIKNIANENPEFVSRLECIQGMLIGHAKTILATMKK